MFRVEPPLCPNCRQPVSAALPQTHRRVAVLGWILYGLSWITPSLDASHIGAWVFLEALTVGVQLTTHFGSLMRTLAGLSLLLGWLSNFSMLFRWPVGMRFLWIVAPWGPFVVLLVKHGPAPSPVSLLYFYPWAVGIGLVHFAAIDIWRISRSK
jgi:hypothetical protein